MAIRDGREVVQSVLNSGPTKMVSPSSRNSGSLQLPYTAKFVGAASKQWSVISAAGTESAVSAGASLGL